MIKNIFVNVIQNYIFKYLDLFSQVKFCQTSKYYHKNIICKNNIFISNKIFDNYQWKISIECYTGISENYSYAYYATNIDSAYNFAMTFVIDRNNYEYIYSKEEALKYCIVWESKKKDDKALKFYALTK